MISVKRVRLVTRHYGRVLFPRLRDFEKRQRGERVQIQRAHRARLASYIRARRRSLGLRGAELEIRIRQLGEKT